MKLKIEREWLLRKAEQEANGIISVGGLATLAEKALKETTSCATERSALAKLVQLQRRKLRMNVEVLAQKSDVDVEEILNVENGASRPEPRTIYKIAGVLMLPATKLMNLAGLVTDRDPNLGSAAIRFAACSSPVEALTAEETKALEEFVCVLGK